ncbi:MAG: MC/SLC25 family protein [Simkaniaceae bacterium]|nr:MC/SLC25 family protein [Simkaniaceae bacterium]
MSHFLMLGLPLDSSTHREQVTPPLSGHETKPTDPSKCKLTSLGHFVNGVLANTTSVLLMQPGFTLKTFMMCGKGLPPIRSLYNGTAVNVISGGPAEGIAFLAHFVACSFFRNNSKSGELSDGGNLAASIIGGALGALAIAPCERVMIQQQLNPGSILQVMRPIINKEGLARAIFRGVSPTAFRDAGCNCAVFGLNDMAVRELRPFISNKEQRELIASVSVGFIVGALTTPFDLLKTDMQASIGKKTSMLQTARKIYAKEGLRAFSKGAVSRALLVAGLVYGITKSKEIAPPYFPQNFYESNR